MRILSLTAALLALAGPLSAGLAKRPNVLFIIIDDSEKVEYGCYGGDSLSPGIDSLARDGILFHNGFTSSSVCTPTRYTVMSGQYASRAQSLRTVELQPASMSTYVRWNTYLEPDGLNIASVLRANGYVTGMVGKWHMGHSPEYEERVANIPGPHYDTENEAVAAGDPRADRSMDGGKAYALDDAGFNRYLRAKYEIATDDIRKHFGFDDVRAFYSGNLTDYPKAMRNFYFHNQDWMTQGAIEFIDENAHGKGPFFLYFSSTLQHGPEPTNSVAADRRITAMGYIDQAPQVQPDAASIYRRLEEAGLPRSRAPYLWFDDGVGAVLQKLKDEGVYDNTLIFFFSDQQSWGKGSCFDGGVCTPYIMSWPATLPRGVESDHLVSNIDFAPTIFDACGVVPPPGMHLDGRSLLPLARGEAPAWRDALFFELGDMRAVRTRDYKYIAVRPLDEAGWAALPEADRESQNYRKHYFRLNKEWNASPDEHLRASKIALWRACHARFASDPDQLYDLRVDPGEFVNLYDNLEYRHTVQEMRRRLGEWLQTMPGPYAELNP